MKARRSMAISEEPTEQTGQRRSGRRAGSIRMPTRRTPYLANGDFRQSRTADKTSQRKAGFKLIESPKSEIEGEIDVVGMLRQYLVAFVRRAPNGYRRIAGARWELKLDTQLEQLRKLQKRQEKAVAR
jgi:hypothetical protein